MPTRTIPTFDVSMRETSVSYSFVRCATFRWFVNLLLYRISLGRTIVTSLKFGRRRELYFCVSHDLVKSAFTLALVRKCTGILTNLGMRFVYNPSTKCKTSLRYFTATSNNT